VGNLSALIDGLLLGPMQMLERVHGMDNGTYLDLLGDLLVRGLWLQGDLESVSCADRMEDRSRTMYAGMMTVVVDGL
jgi:hypothetical protein